MSLEGFDLSEMPVPCCWRWLMQGYIGEAIKEQMRPERL
jgi:hypothetical protein